MIDIETTKMSSKGQIVIPEKIRDRLGLRTGSQFVVIGEEDTVILKVISPPAMEDFDRLIAKARQQARKTGLKRSDIAAIIKKARTKT